MPTFLQYIMMFMVLALFMERFIMISSAYTASRRIKQFNASLKRIMNDLSESEAEARVQTDLLLSGELGDIIRDHLQRMVDSQDINPLEAALQQMNIRRSVRVVISSALSSSSHREMMSLYDNFADSAEFKDQLNEARSMIDNNLEDAKAALLSVGIDPDALASKFS